MKVTVAQPQYYAGENPDAVIADFLKNAMAAVEPGSLLVLPEYSNAGGLSDPEKELQALPRAKEMLAFASRTSREKGAYIAINVLETRDGQRKTAPICLTKRVRPPLSTTRSTCRPLRWRWRWLMAMAPVSASLMASGSPL